MSSPIDETDNQDDHLKYAPKWARDRNQSESPSFAGVEVPPHNEQSFSVNVQTSDEVRAPLLPDFRDQLGRPECSVCSAATFRRSAP